MPQWLIVAIAIAGTLLACWLYLDNFAPDWLTISAAGGEENPTELRRILAKGINPDQPGLFGMTALYCAASTGQIQNVKLLLAYGANPNKLAGKFSPLNKAISGNQLEIVACLLDAGADFMQPDSHGECALMLATKLGRLEILAMLLERGANLSSNAYKGDPLIFLPLDVLTIDPKAATKESMRKTLDFLVKNGANMNVRATCDTPLLFNALYDPPSLRILVDAGIITEVSYEGNNLQLTVDKILAENSP